MNAIPSPEPHIPWAEFPNNIYPPSEDTFLLVDSLEMDMSSLINLESNVVLEVCCGSSYPLVSLASSLGPRLYISTDLNAYALKYSKTFAHHNHIRIDPILTSLTKGIRDDVIDVVLCNPPYVASTPSPHISPLQANLSSESLIDIALNGGLDGMELIHVLLTESSRVLRKSGRLYCIILSNSWDEYCHKNDSYLKYLFSEYKIIARRKSVVESLVTVRFIK